MDQLEHKLASELPITAKVVACRFPFPTWVPEHTEGEGIDAVWVYDSKTFQSNLHRGMTRKTAPEEQDSTESHTWAHTALVVVIFVNGYTTLVGLWGAFINDLFSIHPFSIPSNPSVRSREWSVLILKMEGEKWPVYHLNFNTKQGEKDR